MITAAHRAGWIEQGLAFGYPPCCVLMFPNSPLRGYLMLNPWYGSGYVPCPQCAATPDITDEYIRQNRKVPEPWPGKII